MHIRLENISKPISLSGQLENITPTARNIIILTVEKEPRITSKQLTASLALNNPRV